MRNWRRTHTPRVWIMLKALLGALMPLLALVLLSAATPALPATDLPIGFVSHFPLVRHEDDLVAWTGANVLEVRAPWPLLEPREGQFDFSLLDEQLQYANDNGLRLVYVMESGPAHAAGVSWLIEKLQASGETMVQRAGVPVRDPCIFSPTYRHYLGRYLDRTVRYLAAHRFRDVVCGYNNGCEWWYPLYHSYSPLDAAAFRDYLRRKYRDLPSLNVRWGARYVSFEAIAPPPLEWWGSGVLSQSYLLPASALVDACYCTEDAAHVRVTPGRRLTATVQFTAHDVQAGGVTFEIAWLRADDPHPVRIDMASSAADIPSGDGEVTVQATCPPECARAWLLVKCRAVGEIVFRRVSCTDDSGVELAPNPSLDPALGAWRFIQWSAGEPERVSHSWQAPGEARIRYQPSCDLPSGSVCPLAEVYDWTDFRAAALAEFMDWMAARIRDADPSRPVITYTTLAFANPFEWDYAQQNAVSLDHIARAGEHLGVIGMQLASAEGDCDSVTCALDLVRKYGKPMWAIDLLDFTRGVALGRPGLTRLSLSVFEHGGSGIQYYCWAGTPHYTYTDLGVAELRSMISDIRRAAATLPPVQVPSPVALVMPRMPLYRFLPEPANDWADFMGWYKLLVHFGVTPDIYTLEDLDLGVPPSPKSAPFREAGTEMHGRGRQGGEEAVRPDLSSYRLVILPDCAYVLPEALPALSRARLVTSGRFAHRDMSGRPLAPALLPTATLRFEEPLGALVLGETYRCKTPTDTPPRLVCREGSPHWDLPQLRRALPLLRDLGLAASP